MPCLSVNQQGDRYKAPTVNYKEAAAAAAQNSESALALSDSFNVPTALTGGVCMPATHWGVCLTTSRI